MDEALVEARVQALARVQAPVRAPLGDVGLLRRARWAGAPDWGVRVGCSDVEPERLAPQLGHRLGREVRAHALEAPEAG